MVQLHLALVNERIFWHFIGILLATPFVRDQTKSFSVKNFVLAQLFNYHTHIRKNTRTHTLQSINEHKLYEFRFLA